MDQKGIIMALLSKKCEKCNAKVKIIKSMNDADITVNCTPIAVWVREDSKNSRYKIQYAFYPHKVTCAQRMKYFRRLA